MGEQSERIGITFKMGNVVPELRTNLFLEELSLALGEECLHGFLARMTERRVAKVVSKAGGGYNHRYNLSDGILIKDNHIGAAGGVANAVKLAKEYAPFVRKIEVEVENLDMLREALEAGADIIMLDNMDCETMKKAVEMTNGKALLEASGNITAETIAAVAETGVDIISIGALTHSVKAFDISLKIF